MLNIAPVAQWIERRPSNPQVAGSSPAGGAPDPSHARCPTLAGSLRLFRPRCRLGGVVESEWGPGRNWQPCRGQRGPADLTPDLLASVRGCNSQDIPKLFPGNAALEHELIDLNAWLGRFGCRRGIGRFRGRLWC